MVSQRTKHSGKLDEEKEAGIKYNEEKSQWVQKLSAAIIFILLSSAGPIRVSRIISKGFYHFTRQARKVAQEAIIMCREFANSLSSVHSFFIAFRGRALRSDAQGHTLASKKLKLAFDVLRFAGRSVMRRSFAT